MKTRIENIIIVCLCILFWATFSISYIKSEIAWGSEEWWVANIVSVFFIIFGSYWAINYKKMVIKNHLLFKRLSVKYRLEMYKEMSERMIQPHMFILARALTSCFAIIGLTILVDNLINLSSLL